MEELKEIIGVLSEIREECQDDLVFSKAIDIYLMRQQEKNKDTRTETINKTQQFKPASDKQINFLKKLNYKGDMTRLSKYEASVLIDKLTSKSFGGENEEYDY